MSSMERRDRGRTRRAGSCSLTRRDIDEEQEVVALIPLQEHAARPDVGGEQRVERDGSTERD